jgi:hypothetical protein
MRVQNSRKSPANYAAHRILTPHRHRHLELTKQDHQPAFAEAATDGNDTGDAAGAKRVRLVLQRHIATSNEAS